MASPYWEFKGVKEKKIVSFLTFWLIPYLDETLSVSSILLENAKIEDFNFKNEKLDSF